MNIAILGTGTVGATLGLRLVELGHNVMMGSRVAGGTKATSWVASAPTGASEGTFAEAAKHGEIIFNCTAGIHTLAALEMAGAENLNGKILVDVSNPLDFSKGFPPTLDPVSSDSLSEQIQRTYPAAKVVKVLNTVANEVMVHPERVPGNHTLLMCGDDNEAKTTVTQFLEKNFGWTHILDLGDITNARGTEAWLLLWVRLWQKFKTPYFNIEIHVGEHED